MQTSFNTSIIDHLSTAVLWVDTQLHLKYINSAAQSLLELSESQAMGHRLDVLFPCMTQMQQVRTQQTQLIEYGIEIKLLSGTTLTINCTITPVHDNQRQLEGLLIEIVQIDQQLHLSQIDSVMSQNEANYLMVRGLAHEIKNPLGGVRGAAQLLARAVTDKSLQEYTDVIIAEADRLRDLVDRLSAPPVMSRQSSTNIHQLICRVSLLLQSKPQNGQLNIQQDFDPSIPEVNMDADQVYQVLLNLMQNAEQAMEKQRNKQLILTTRIQRNTTIGKKYHRMCVRIDIQDNGRGIDEKLLPKIFYPMVTGRANGIGLGLSIAQNLAQKNGGIITCRSEPRATTFSLLLPFNH